MKTSEKEVDQMGDIGEDLPDKPLPNKNLPPIKGMDPDEDLENIKDKSKGIDKALEQIEEYDE